MIFADRRDAGRQLAVQLAQYANRPDAVVLALPRGGVPVAFEIAEALGLLLDVFIVRKLGVPGNEEFTFGAVASGGAKYIDARSIEQAGITQAEIDEVVRREMAGLEEREREYRHGRPAHDIVDRIAILVDDGLATGSTMRAAIEGLRKRRPARVVVAVPLGAAPSCREIKEAADEAICLATPEPFLSVSQWYGQFEQTTDEEVRSLLAQADEARSRRRAG